METVKRVLLTVLKSRRFYVLLAGLLLMLLEPILRKFGVTATPDEVATLLEGVGLMVIGAGTLDRVAKVSKPADTELLKPDFK